MQLAELNSLVRSHKLALLDVYADWCEPCKMLDVILDDLNQRMQGSLPIIKMDADVSEEIKSEYDIRSVPVLILFKEGVPVWRMNGFMMADELEKVIIMNQ